MTREEYEAVADKVITNNGTVTELEEAVKAMLEQELGLRGIKIAK